MQRKYKISRLTIAWQNYFTAQMSHVIYFKNAEDKKTPI